MPGLRQVKSGPGVKTDSKAEPEAAPARVRTIRSKVSGANLTNPDGTRRQYLIECCSPGEELLLLRDRDNPYDPNAIKVCLRAGQQLGHMNTRQAAEVAPLMDAGREVRARVAEITGGPDQRRPYGLEIEILVVDEAPISKPEPLQKDEGERFFLARQGDCRNLAILAPTSLSVVRNGARREHEIASLRGARVERSVLQNHLIAGAVVGGAGAAAILGGLFGRSLLALLLGLTLDGAAAYLIHIGLQGCTTLVLLEAAREVRYSFTGRAPRCDALVRRVNELRAHAPDAPAPAGAPATTRPTKKRPRPAGPDPATMIALGGVAVACLLVALLVWGATRSSHSRSLQSGGGMFDPQLADDFDLVEYKLVDRGNRTVVAGTIRNNSGKTYTYAQVQFNLHDESGTQVGSTAATINNLQPGEEWKFEAPVQDKRAKSVKLKGVSGW